MRGQPMSRHLMSPAEEKLSVAAQKPEESPEPFGAEIIYQEQRFPVEVQGD